MKLLHISDLHIGKRVNEFSMEEDQRYILAEISDIIKDRGVDALIIAGDIYDKQAPSAEAVALFDDFLSGIASEGVGCYIISGNHDSPERLAFGSKLMSAAGVHISRPFEGAPECFYLQDEFGTVEMYLLPFVRPANVRRFFPDEDVPDCGAAVRLALADIPEQSDNRRVLAAHQFVVSGGSEPLLSDSETFSVGGLSAVNSTLFDRFDYVALGHIHCPQSSGRAEVRYCGTPLKYSFSEAGQKKSAVFIELKEKGSVSIELIPLKPLRDMREVKGPLAALAAEAVDTDDYMHVTLTDDDMIDAISKVRLIYPNVMRLDFDNARTSAGELEDADMPEDKSPEELFSEFFEKQNGMPLEGQRAQIAQKLLEDIEGGLV